MEGLIVVLTLVVGVPLLAYLQDRKDASRREESNAAIRAAKMKADCAAVDRERAAREARRLAVHNRGR